MKPKQRLSTFGSILLILSVIIGSRSLAADKALLIGATQYRNAAYNLSGIDLDLAAMRHIALRLGYQHDNILALTGSLVTKENIASAFSNFLSIDTEPDDKLLIYYSGHGVQLFDNGADEVDSRDEALSLYSLEPTDDGYSGVLLDDELSELLRTLESKHIFVIVDACHSGTVTRGVTTNIPLQTKAYGDTTFQVKNLPFRQGVQGDNGIKQSVNMAHATDEVAGVINLSAAQDHEKALATESGSAFTMALAESIDTLGINATVKELFEAASSILEKRIDPRYAFSPNLTGDISRFEQTLSVATNSDSRTNWESAMRLERLTPPLNASISRQKYLEYEPIEISHEISEPGYLNILGIDAEDNMVLLFPNRFHTDNRVIPGSTVLPGELGFEWNALEPWGENLLLLLHSSQSINLLDTSLQRNIDGNMEYDFVLPSAEGLRRLGFIGEDAIAGDLSATSLRFKTCRTDNDC